MTKDDRKMIDQVIGYIRAKKESGKIETFPAEQIIAISQALFVCEKEFHSLEYHATVQSALTDAVRETLRKYIKKNRHLENEKKLDAMEIGSLEKKLREKTYPIDREFKLKKERDEYKEIADLQGLCIKRFADKLNEADDKIGLQQIEIGKLGGLLKEADDCIVFYRNTTGVEPKDIKLYSDSSTTEQIECMVKIHELFKKLRGVKNG